MATETIPTTMTGEEMIALSKKHTLFEWSAQSKVDPIPVARAKGIYFWTPEGKRFIDFNSQLMCVNIGHGDERVLRAIRGFKRELPVIIASGYATVESQAAWNQAGAQGFVAKPYRIQDVALKLREVLDRTQPRVG